MCGSVRETERERRNRDQVIGWDYHCCEDRWLLLWAAYRVWVVESVVNQCASDIQSKLWFVAVWR